MGPDRTAFSAEDPYSTEEFPGREKAYGCSTRGEHTPRWLTLLPMLVHYVCMSCRSQVKIEWAAPQAVCGCGYDTIGPRRGSGAYTYLSHPALAAAATLSLGHGCEEERKEERCQVQSRNFQPARSEAAPTTLAAWAAEPGGVQGGVGAFRCPAVSFPDENHTGLV